MQLFIRKGDLMSRAKKICSQLLEYAGITINGSNSWDIQVKEEKFYDRLLTDQNLGLGESYMENWWECTKIDEMIARILEADLDEKVRNNKNLIFQTLLHRLVNFQTKRRSLEVAKRHYDLGNDLYRNMLDEGMTYSCGYWKKASNLRDAQRDKLELLCQKLLLKPGMKLLDIGCGWGSLAKHAAENYGVDVVGVTISKEQIPIAKERCKGLPVSIRLQDYRDVHEKFDRVVSVGMFEHVGAKNYRTFMKKAFDCLKADGIFVLHTIGKNVSTVTSDPWISKYIFPNSLVPSLTQIAHSIEGLFTMEDWHNFGADYDKTLIAWHNNFNANWNKLKGKFDDRFYRMWSYYLLSCAGAFRVRSLQLWQIILSKQGIRNSYPIRDLI